MPLQSPEFEDEIATLEAFFGPEDFRTISSPDQWKLCFDLPSALGKLKLVLLVNASEFPGPNSVEFQEISLNGEASELFPASFDDGILAAVQGILTALEEGTSPLVSVEKEQQPTDEELDELNPLQPADFVALCPPGSQLLDQLATALRQHHFADYHNGTFFFDSSASAPAAKEDSQAFHFSVTLVHGNNPAGNFLADSDEGNRSLSVCWPQLLSGSWSPSEFVRRFVDLHKPAPLAPEVREAGPIYMTWLPTASSLGLPAAGSQRALTIYTWGVRLRKSAPPDSQHTYNAAVLNGRGGGANLRTENGLCDSIQKNVASCSLFPQWLEWVVKDVEAKNYKAISVTCMKGRHRSVAAAELLKRLYFPRANLAHLTIV